jgi:hypothetical protein
MTKQVRDRNEKQKMQDVAVQAAVQTQAAEEIEAPAEPPAYHLVQQQE